MKSGNFLLLLGMGIKEKIDITGTNATRIAKLLYPDMNISVSRSSVSRKIKGEIGWNNHEISNLQEILLSEAKRLEENAKELVKKAKKLKLLVEGAD